MSYRSIGPFRELCNICYICVAPDVRDPRPETVTTGSVNFRLSVSAGAFLRLRSWRS